MHWAYQRPFMNPKPPRLILSDIEVDIPRTRIYIPDGRVDEHAEMLRDATGFGGWLAIPRL